MKKVRRPEDLTVHVKGKNMTVTPALHDQVVRKMEKLAKYLDRLQTIDVELRTENTRAAAFHNCVEATTRVRGKSIRVTSTNEDMFAAIDEAVDKLYRQLNRQKERMKSHQGDKLTTLVPVGEAESEDVDETVDADVEPGGGHTGELQVERLIVEPQFEEEAIQEMEALHHDFYVFLNARNERVSVLYRRSDGGYGLIEPHVAR